ncbi:MAG TPA: hypothetical protein VGP33_12160 [Chloroflexota bacterium]|nr:hypothetical protein [Chloroflexota bacterium]
MAAALAVAAVLAAALVVAADPAALLAAAPVVAELVGETPHAARRAVAPSPAAPSAALRRRSRLLRRWSEARKSSR